MKQLKSLLAFIMLSSLFINAYSQECSVIPTQLKGKYEGSCEKGKAQGQGKAFGIDSYEGEFKKGYPEGKGMYVWPDGHYFVGNFKKGQKEGWGQMYYESQKGEDSVITGYWKDDKYIGEYEKQYEIKSMSSGVTRTNCRAVQSKGTTLTFTIGKISGLAAITDINVLTGRFILQNTQMMNNNSITRVQQVEFPFRAIFTFSDGEQIDILFNEPSDYDISIELR